MPAVSFRSLIGSGTPRNGPSARLAAQRAPRRADGDEGVQLRVEPLDPLEVQLDELGRRDLAAADEVGLLGRGQEGELVHSLRSSISTAITGPRRRASRVLRVLGAQQLHARARSSTIRARAAQPDPPEPRPVLLVVVDQHLDVRVRLDVPQALQRAACASACRRPPCRACRRRARSRSGRRAGGPRASTVASRATRASSGDGKAGADERLRPAQAAPCRPAGSSGSASGGAPNEAATRSGGGVAVERRPLARRCGRRRGSSPPSARAASPGRGSRRPRARSTRSSASRPGRCTPARSAAAAPSGPSFTHEAWMFVIHGWSASRATACTSRASRKVGPRRARPFR